MPSYADTYTPVIEAALNGDQEGHRLLSAVAEGLVEENSDKFPDLDTATAFVRRNFRDYSETLTHDEFATVRAFYGLDDEPHPEVSAPSL